MQKLQNLENYPQPLSLGKNSLLCHTPSQQNEHPQLGLPKDTKMGNSKVSKTPASKSRSRQADSSGRSLSHENSEADTSLTWEGEDQLRQRLGGCCAPGSLLAAQEFKE